MLCKDETGGECRKPIEDVEVGDLVRAYDEESGESGWKPVLSLSRNSTLTTHHLSFESDELIVCTPEHPFYILNARKGTPIVNFEGREESAFDGQWVQAKYLKVGDKVLLSDGKTAILTNTELEHLSEPITTYSFEVQDFHTYYVGEQGILVHNDCPIKPGTKEWNQAVKDIQNSGNSKGKLNYTVKNKATSTRLANDAGLPLQSLDDVIYVHSRTGYTFGYEIHPIDNSVGMPHFKFWSGRINGHIYWPGR